MDMPSVTPSFFVLDTEGYPQLTELAVVNAQGQVVLQAYTQFYSDYLPSLPFHQPRKQALQRLAALVHSVLVCHYAEHDKTCLQHNFAQEQLPWPEFQFICTWTLAKNHTPGLKSYRLGYLCQHWRLSPPGYPLFNLEHAHAASYDALYTLQLYRFLTYSEDKRIMSLNPTALLTNPFGDIRVDTPFQQHLDYGDIHQAAFDYLMHIIEDIQQDENKQSRGVVVLGDAGCGKTHLMMRLAQRRLKNNRLLFIRQPNHSESVLYHIYSRVLESLVEEIPGTAYTQLEYLLGRSFSKIVLGLLEKKSKLTQIEQKIQQNLALDFLNIYKTLGKQGTELKRKNWSYIEKKTLEWWEIRYGFSGYAGLVIRGLIKFCRYSDPQRRQRVQRWLAGHQLDSAELESIQLSAWSENMTREEFALEAIAVFGKLSIVDAPLIMIFDQLEGLKYHQTLLMRFGEAVKELFTHVPNSLIICNLFPDRWQQFQSLFDGSILDRLGQYQVSLPLPDAQQLRQLLLNKAQAVALDLTQLFSAEDFQHILAQPSIRSVLNRAAEYYRLYQSGIPLPRQSVHFEQQVWQEITQIKQTITQLYAIVAGDNPSASQAITIAATVPISEMKAHNNAAQSLSTYLHEQQQRLDAQYDRPVIISSSDDIGKLNTIFSAFQPICGYQLDILHFGKRKLPDHLLIKHPSTDKQVVIAFLHCDGFEFAPKIKNFNELVVNYKQIYFVLFRDQREPAITGKVGQDQTEKLNHSDNGRYRIINRNNRVCFELIYQCVTAIINKDVDYDMSTAYQALQEHIGHKYWLFRATDLTDNTAQTAFPTDNTA